jgi:NADP-dependent 3-hydroxy acid dehydrogenase YdfG
MAHFVRRLVEQGYRVAMVARFEAVMKSLAAELPQTATYRLRHWTAGAGQGKVRDDRERARAGRRAHRQCRQGGTEHSRGGEP